jgi:hypothetical protein
MVEPPVSYLESAVPTAACEMAIVFRSTGCAFFACRDLSLRIPSPSSATSSAPSAPWREKKITAGELSARAKANGYQRGVYRDKDSLRDRKHVDKAEKD